MSGQAFGGEAYGVGAFAEVAAEGDNGGNGGSNEVSPDGNGQGLSDGLWLVWKDRILSFGAGFVKEAV